MRPPDLPGGNSSFGEMVTAAPDIIASMRPPDLPGGNKTSAHRNYGAEIPRFNEAAGFTRRKPLQSVSAIWSTLVVASMRPPDLPGGNQGRP